jgi:hypothetical protein
MVPQLRDKLSSAIALCFVQSPASAGGDASEAAKQQGRRAGLGHDGQDQIGIVVGNAERASECPDEPVRNRTEHAIDRNVRAEKRIGARAKSGHLRKSKVVEIE